ncbi:hypothetical protein G7046_g4153 [Stylonectria norvegica]|nr:hypothetical protein G7046_g4153 [Stylonectria norvegica]
MTSSPTTTTTSSVLIIGAGNFGAATALTLIKKGVVKVTLVDTAAFPNPRAASHDVNKIVRDDYPDKLYMRMLAKAMPMWRTDDLYKTWYHEVGMLRADDSTFGDESIAAYRDMGIANDSEFLPVEDVRKRWNGAFATADFGALDRVLYNPSVGFAEADKALGAVVQAAVDLGVEYLIGVMTTLEFGPQGQCTGIKLQDGRTLHADKILLATGARTAPLLVQSAPDNKELHVGDRLLATGAVSFHAKLQGAQREKFAPIPVLKNCLPQVKGEGMSILQDGTIKFNCDLCFTNYKTFPLTGEKMSVAPDETMYNMWTGPRFLKFFEDRARKTINGLYGKEVEHVKIDAYRMCWDASTPTHDFLVTPHPHCDNLYLATGGSFHGWKFLPVIGEYVADMMQGTLGDDYVDRWAWDKKGGDGHSANPTYQIVGDLQDWTRGWAN